MASVKHIVHLQSLPLFLKHFQLGEKQISKIVKALNQGPLPRGRVSILLLLHFLQTNKYRLSVDQESQKFQDTNKLTKILLRYKHLKELNTKKLVSSIRMLSALNKTYLIIELSNTYNKSCVHYAFNNIIYILWRPAKGDSFYMHNLFFLCNGGGVDRNINDRVYSIKRYRDCFCKNRTLIML